MSNRTDNISMHQKKYTSQTIAQYQTENANKYLTPILVDVGSYNNCCQDTILGEEDKKTDSFIMGSMMYAGLGTQPDISYSIIDLRRSVSKPMRTHITAVRQLLKYLKATPEVVLCVKATIAIDVKQYFI